jgi:hypothetical protein
MKKVFILLGFITIIAGCTKTSTLDQQAITGNWVLYKYVLRNADQTNMFETMYPGYSITFLASGAFVITDTTGFAKGGTYHFTSNYQKIALDDTMPVFVDSILVDSIVEQQYSIFNLSSVSLQLRNDSSELYLEKKL